MPPTTIDWRQLSIRLILTLILPVGAAVLIDKSMATFPFLTMLVALVCIPVATIVVIRSALKELERVIAEVAPLEQVEDEEAAPGAGGSGLPDASV